MSFIRNLFGKGDKQEAPPPSAQDLEEAKKIFFDYSCNGLYMAQNDVNFRKYRIPRELEAQWRNEFIALWRSRLSSEDLTAIQKLREAEAVEAIPDLLGMVDQGDSYARLRVAQALLALGYLCRDKDLKNQALDAATWSARLLLEQPPLQITEPHRAEIARLGGSDPEAYIRRFALDIAR